MDDTIFRKMKVKPGMSVTLLHTPPDYPDYDGFSHVENNKSDFVHLFITNRAEFFERFTTAVGAAADGGLLWLSYPKASGKQKPDINRDSLWELVLPHGWHPVAQVALDETWSAIRLKQNEPGVVYERPGNMKAGK